jgi:hypothetical protein
MICSSVCVRWRDFVATVLNDTFYPILLWSTSEPFAPGELDAHVIKLAAIADKGIRNRTRHVVVVTTTSVNLSAAGRKSVAAALHRHLTPAQNDVSLASFLPVDSTVIRGILTAFRWLSPESVKSVRMESSPGAALEAALKALEAYGTPFTGDRQALRRAFDALP